MFFELETVSDLPPKSIGYHRLYKFKFSMEDVVSFAELTGDKNPIHLDSDYAKNTVFKEPIVHGLLVTSTFSRIFGADYPGTGSVYLGQTIKFLAPVYMDRFYYAEACINAVSEKSGKVTLSTKILDSDGKEVLTGEAILINEMFKS